MSELKPYYISNNNDYIGIRKKEQNDVFNKLKRDHFVFIEAGLGSGVYGFIYSLTLKYKKEKNYFRVNLSDVIVKNQINDCFVAYTGVNPQLLIFEMNKEVDKPYVIILDNIRGDIDSDAMNYLLQLVSTSRSRNNNIYFIFVSTVTFQQYKNSTIKLNNLSLDETSLILRGKFTTSKLSHDKILDLYNLSEGLIIKLEQIISCLSYSSLNEVLEEDGLFDDIYESDDIPQDILRQIDYISKQPNKLLTFTMLKILAILKNGESLSNLKKDKLGEKLTLKNTKEIIQLGLASVTEIDSTTTLIKLNPIIKDYVITLITEEEAFSISNAYLKLIVSENKKGIHLGVTNRKIIDNGYNTEEDNANVLFRNSILECKIKINSENIPKTDLEYYKNKLSKLLYLSLAYVYSLDNSCRYKEAISAASSLLQITNDIENPSAYKLFYHLGSCQRMLSYDDEAIFNLNKARELCPINEKKILEKIIVEELYLLEDSHITEAIAMAKKHKKQFKANSVGHISCDFIISTELPKGQRIYKLELLEKKCRRLEYHTLANNILFALNTIKEDADKISKLNKVMATDNSSYNYCKAMIFKHEILASNNEFHKISESEINQLINIFNYMFKQGFNSLLNRCHDLLWRIADNRRNDNLIVIIYFKSSISWQLNDNRERLEKYNELFNKIDYIEFKE